MRIENIKTIHIGTREFTLKNNVLYYNGAAVPVRTIYSDYTYKINKTCISAYGGAAKLYEFIEDCILNSFGLIWVDAIESACKRLVRE